MYINLMIEINKKKYVCFWLLLITFLVAIMIIVGGLTRLTDSGLSITEWQLFSGILPPLDTNDWNYYFSLYKTTSEYKLINSSMTKGLLYVPSASPQFKKVVGLGTSPPKKLVTVFLQLQPI